MRKARLLQLLDEANGVFIDFRIGKGAGGDYSMRITADAEVTMMVKRQLSQNTWPEGWNYRAYWDPQHKYLYLGQDES